MQPDVLARQANSATGVVRPTSPSKNSGQSKRSGRNSISNWDRTPGSGFANTGPRRTPPRPWRPRTPLHRTTGRASLIFQWLYSWACPPRSGFGWSQPLPCCIAASQQVVYRMVSGYNVEFSRRRGIILSVPDTNRIAAEYPGFHAQSKLDRRQLRTAEPSVASRSADRRRSLDNVRRPAACRICWSRKGSQAGDIQIIFAKGENPMSRNRLRVVFLIDPEQLDRQRRLVH